MRLSILVMALMVASGVASAAPPQYTYKEPYPNAPVAYVADNGKKVYLVPAPTEDITSSSMTSVTNDLNQTPVPTDGPIWSVGAEVGYHSFDTSTWDAQALADTLGNALRSKSWTNVAETSTLSISNLYEGVFLKVDPTKNFTVGGGYRFYNLGSVQATAKSNVGVQYTTFTDTQGISANCFYLNTGFGDFVTPNLKASLNIEAGLLLASMTDTWKWDGYNGSYFDSHQNTKLSGSGTLYSLVAGLDYYFTRHFIVSLDVGYKFAKLQAFKVDSVDANFATSTKVGDKATSLSGGDVGFNLNGLMTGLKVSYAF